MYLLSGVWIVTAYRHPGSSIGAESKAFSRTRLFG